MKQPWPDSASSWHHVRREQIPSPRQCLGSRQTGGRGRRSVLRLQMQRKWSLGNVKPACQGQWGRPSGKGAKQDKGQNGWGRGKDAEHYRQFHIRGRPQTETKDGLLLRGACETKTMHAKKVFGEWWGRRGRTRNQKTNSGGMPISVPPGPPRHPMACGPVVKGHLGICVPHIPRTEGRRNLLGWGTGCGPAPGLLYAYAGGQGWCSGSSADHVGGVERPCGCVLGQMHIRWRLGREEWVDGQRGGGKQHSATLPEDSSWYYSHPKQGPNKRGKQVTPPDLWSFPSPLIKLSEAP